MAPGPEAARFRAGTAQCTEITFRRAVEVPLGRSRQAIVEWWRRSAHDGVLDIGPSRLSSPPGGRPGRRPADGGPPGPGPGVAGSERRSGAVRVAGAVRDAAHPVPAPD